MTLEDKFAGMALDEPIKIEVEGETLELDMRVEDIVPLMSMGAKEGGVGEDDVETLTETFRTILRRSYLPYYDDVRDQEPENLNDARQEENDEAKKFIDGLLVRKLPTLVNKIVEALGWDDDVSVDNADFPAKNQQQ